MRCGLLWLCLITTALAQSDNCRWPAWEDFKSHYITSKGRVIDPYEGRNITTSEGQSYALFFALVANDQQTFINLLNWTETHLAKGDLAKNLPAWLWGKSIKPPIKWQILDTNSAADADLWISYSLLEAGRLWNKPKYYQLGQSLLERIRLEEIDDLPQLGPMVLPGKLGFSHDKTPPIDDNAIKNSEATSKHRYWRLNPSYTPPQLITRFTALHPIWSNIATSNLRVLTEGAPTGLAPDWLVWDEKEGFQPIETGSYDAIRVYLWIGMLADDDPQKKILLAHYSNLLTLMNGEQFNGFPPEKINIIEQRAISTNSGPLGFSAALLPFLQNNPNDLEKQKLRLSTQSITKDAYYTTVLRLFGQGFDEHYFQFNRYGELLPAWSTQCNPSQ